MTLLGLVLLLLVAAVCGSLGMAIGGFDRGGLLVSIGIGLVGAVLGRWLAAEMRLPEIYTIHIQGESFPIAWAIIGSTAFVLVVGILRRALR